MTDQELVARWREFLNEVEQGYELGLEDYRNELDVRAMIAERGLDAQVRGEDARFRKMLTGMEKRIWETPSAEGFWEFGYPANSKGELLADLQAEGLL